MVIKKSSKKFVKKIVKKKPAKKTKKPKEVKLIEKPKIVQPAAFEQEVIKKLEQEVRKPGLGEIKGVKDKRFIPQRPRFEPKRFLKKRFEQRNLLGARFKSHGERQIAEFLKEERIHFLYEYPLAITDEERKVRIWYPDFWLPELNIIIEYIGMKGKIDYDKASMRKKKIYNALKIDFIEISPGLLVKGNWKRFISMKIISIMKSKNYLFNKMKALSMKYRIPAEERAKENVGLEILDQT